MNSFIGLSKFVSHIYKYYERVLCFLMYSCAFMVDYVSMEFKTTLSKFNVNDQNFLDVSLESEKILQSSCQDRSLAIVILLCYQ